MPASLGEQESSDWRLTGQVGGVTKALCLEGDTLYVGSGLHVMVLDVSDPEAAVVLGTSPLLPQFVESIESDAAGHLFVCCGDGGLAILDVSQPAAPAVLSVLDTRGYTEGVALYGDYAVLADGPQGVQIADVTDLTKPALVSEAYPLAYVYDVAIQGNTAYAAGGGSGLFTIDLSDPKQPAEARMVSLDGCQYDALIAEGRLYLAGAWGGVSAFDIGEPLAPKLISSTKTSGWAMALSDADHNLLVLDGADGAMLYGIAGVRPALMSTFTLFGFVGAGAINGKTAFLLDEEFGLVAVDYSNKSSPALLSRWMPLTEARRVSVDGTTAYVAGGLSGMHVIDLSDRSNPRDAFWHNSDGGYVNNILVEGDKAYLSTHIDTREPLAIFDVSNPLSPKELGSVPNDEVVFNSAFRSFALGDEAAYIAGEHAALTVDIRDAAHPKVTSRIDLDIEPNSGAARGDLFVTGPRLQVFDVSDPQNIQFLSSMDNNSSGEAVAFLDDATVLCAGEPGIWVVDLTDPANPQKIGELALSGSPMGITLDGDTAYICTLGNGIRIVDFSNRANPALLETIETLGDANACCIDGTRLIVADSVAGLTIYERGGTAAAAVSSASGGYTLTMLTGEDAVTTPYTPPEPISVPDEAYTYVVTSTADSGEGSLRYALERLAQNTTITFDPTVFSVKNPATITLETALPEIVADYLTLDASDAGVILDGSRLSDGNGLTVRSSHCKIMGMQILNFPQNGIQGDGSWNQFGGSRAVGAGPLGQGNLLSGNGICGIVTGGWYSVIKGNFVGTDLTGTQPYPNYDGIFVTDWGFYVTVGSTDPDESNVASGNDFINMDTWGDHTRIVGNIIGLDASGTKIVKYDSYSNLTLECTAKNTVAGGTTPEERNIISGAQIGVVFSDTTSYQNAVIGNYIGTDITGTKALGNHFGASIWACSHHRIGGAAAGEGNLISGNENGGAGLSGYACSDNFILGNRIGVDADGDPLPNGTGIDVNTGQRHGTIGGYTAAEGNLVVGGAISLRITNRGIKGCYFAGNTVINPDNLMLYLEDGVSDCFVQNNTFGGTSGNAVRVDYGTGNSIRGNVFAGDRPQDLILLLEGGNGELPPPTVASVSGSSFSGEACAFGRVEVYLYDPARIASIGFADADADGHYTFAGTEPLDGKQVILIVTDAYNNTSAFSQIVTLHEG
ncbi:MAG: hypothetical protein GX417_13670 [Clostridiales bacterium]|nr:hypothetical protein [Clostridiales bacterium]